MLLFHQYLYLLFWYLQKKVSRLPKYCRWEPFFCLNLGNRTHWWVYTTFAGDTPSVSDTNWHPLESPELSVTESNTINSPLRGQLQVIVNKNSRSQMCLQGFRKLKERYCNSKWPNRWYKTQAIPLYIEEFLWYQEQEKWFHFKNTSKTSAYSRNKLRPRMERCSKIYKCWKMHIKCC